ncbi:MAG: hypothetical protein IKR67_07305, partial [Lachnospiraceae bacterium]|nr:hypothetical protein [Lachnospiraceae bacterium]
VFENVEPGATVTTTATYTITLEDVIAKSFKNTVTAQLGNITKEAEATVETEKIAITIEAESDSKVYDGEPLTKDAYKEVTGLAEGDEVTSVTVTGSQTLVGSSDNVPGAAVIKNGDLDVTDAYEITYVNGTLTVTDGSGEGEDPVDPSLVVTKSVDDTEYALGATVTFEITATNIYADARAITFTEIEGVTLEQAVFENVEPGATVTTTATYVITEADILAGKFENTVTATISDGITKEAKATAKTEEKNGHITIDKVTTSTPANGKTYALGEEIKYEITVTNDGNLTITDITVTDELTGDEWTIESLAPGKSVSFETSYIVTEEDVLAGTVYNVATAEGTSPDPDKPEVPVIPGEDPEPTDSPNGHITIEKVTTSTPANGETYALDEEITYEITVTNDGNLTITDIVVTDELTGDEWTIGSLAPGESQTFNTSYIVTQADLEAGSVRNEATGTGTSPDEENPDVPVTPGVDTEPTEGFHQLTITADDITIDYGDEEPELTATGEGFVNGEDIGMIEFKIEREPGDEPGEYKITVTGETTQGHYKITFVCGTLTILPGEYEFTKGSGQTWTKGSGVTADFEVTRSIHDERAYGFYLDIEIDGNLVDKSQYSYEEGCVELYISADYMETLEVGEHSIKAIFKDGEAETDFFVEAAEKKDDNPSTRDENNIPLWMALMMASLGGFIGILFCDKKRKKNEQ